MIPSASICSMIRAARLYPIRSRRWSIDADAVFAKLSSLKSDKSEDQPE